MALAIQPRHAQRVHGGGGPAGWQRGDFLVRVHALHRQQAPARTQQVTADGDDADTFGFDVTEDPYQHLVSVVENLLGRRLPPIARRWAGVYSQCLDSSELVYRSEVSPGVWVVTGPGGRGMTLGPAIGDDTADLMNL